MTPYQQLVIAAMRLRLLIEWGIPAVADIPLPYWGVFVIAKGEEVDASTWARLSHFWDLCMELYD